MLESAVRLYQLASHNFTANGFDIAYHNDC